jgi:hypothetical protein
MGMCTVHPAMNSDGAHVYLDRAEADVPGCPLKKGQVVTWTAKQQTAGDVISLLKNYSGLRVHEGGL